MRDGGTEHDVQTMDAASESQRQMMRMTQLDNINDDNGDDKLDMPPEVENDIIQVVISVHERLSWCNHFDAGHCIVFSSVYSFRNI